VRVLLIALAIALAGAADARAAKPLYVDGHSVGGRCSDARTPAQARHAATPWCTIAHAAAAAGPRAQVLVRRGRYPAPSIDGVRRRSTVTLAPKPGERVTLGGLTISGSSRIRVRGFTIRGGHESTIELSSDVELAGNDISRRGVFVYASRHVSLVDNRIHDISQDASDFQSGYGVYANGMWQPNDRRNGLDGLRIVGNRILRVSQDGIQVGGQRPNMRDVTIERNEIAYVNAARAPGAGNHSDGIQLIGADGAVIRGNSIHDADECILVKDDVATGLVLEHNLLVGSGSGQGHCVQIYDAPRARIVANTFWQESTDWPQALVIGYGGLARPVGTIVRDNIINKYQLENPAWVRQDYNLIGSGPVIGPHDLRGLPRFTGGFRLAPGSPGAGAASDRGDIGAF
jgi:Right handed beta helix region